MHLPQRREVILHRLCEPAEQLFGPGFSKAFERALERRRHVDVEPVSALEYLVYRDRRVKSFSLFKAVHVHRQHLRDVVLSGAAARYFDAPALEAVALGNIEGVFHI
ncbi:hypothetical protein SDC9_187391 [bioreactor metagenome]|uniref:Uncharacterized protein n=1 Tax=bioreactor metagenome TaxID=1076179 RepID=A0A645HLQ9_9ZZZZ